MYSENKPLPVFPGPAGLRSRLAQPGRRLSYYWLRLGDFWAPELISIATTLTLFGVYLYLLQKFDGRPTSSWLTDSGGISGLVVSLPAAISFLATVMRAAIGLPVASAIGQLKWHQFRRRPRQLLEFDHFDNATRGLTGSLSFLLSRHFWSPASIGCIVIVTGLFFGTFLQNALEQELQWHEADNSTARASLPVVGNFSTFAMKTSDEENTGFLVAPVPVQAAIGRGWLYGNSLEPTSSDLSNFLSTDCSTLNCQWGNFSTLALLHHCTSHQPSEVEVVPTSFGQATVATSEEAGLNSTHFSPTRGTIYTLLNMQQSPRVPRASAYASRQRDLAILAHVGIMGDYSGTGDNFEAIECIFYWGASRGAANITNGTLSESRLESYAIAEGGGVTSEADFKFGDVSIKAPWPCYFNSTSPTSDESCEYTVSGLAQHGLYNSLFPYLDGWAARFQRGEEANSTEEGEVVDTVMRLSNLQMDTLMWAWTNQVFRAGQSGRTAQLVDLTNFVFNNVGFFVTNTMRMSSLERHASTGIATVEDVYFNVNYAYVILPGAMVAMSVLFFAGVAFWTRREYAWRNSQLPLLYHGLENPGPRDWSVKNMAGMSEAAAGTEVQMHGGKDGDQLRLQRVDDGGLEYWRRNGGV